MKIYFIKVFCKSRKTVSILNNFFSSKKKVTEACRELNEKVGCNFENNYISDIYYRVDCSEIQ